MKRLLLLSITAVVISSFSSCIVLSSKKYKSLLSERDSLSTGWDGAKVRIKSLEESIENLKTQLSKETKERDLQIDFLQKELKKNVNWEYIRNVLVNFLTNKDFTVNPNL